MSTTPDTRSPGRALRSVVAGAGALAVVLMLAGTYLDTPWKRYGSQRWSIEFEAGHGLTGLLFVAGFAALGLWAVHGIWLRKALAKPAATTAWHATRMAMAGVAGIVVFWTGLPILLGVAAAYAAADSRSRLGRTPIRAAVAAGVGVLLVVAAVQLSVTG